jgi:hypothetical protein
MRSLANEQALKHKEKLGEWFAVDLVERYYSHSSLRNVWHLMDFTKNVNGLLCSGIEINQPQIEFQNGRILFSMQKRDGLATINNYCDLEELSKIHPAKL